VRGGVRGRIVRLTLTWGALGLSTAGLTAGLATAGLPSPAMFAAVLTGLACALLASGVPAAQVVLPDALVTASHAGLGVSIGALVQLPTLAALATSWGPVTLVVLATLGLSVCAGLVLGHHPATSRSTGVFAMVAGGAVGIMVVAKEMGADDRQVAAVQYLRLLLIVAFMPVAVQTLFDAGSEPTSRAGDASTWWLGLAVALVCGGVGLAAGALLRLPAATMLGPMLVAAGATLAGWTGGATVPGPLLHVVYAIIGLDIGLRFTRGALVAVRRILPLAAPLVLFILLASAGLGWVLTRATGITPLEGYLATTPGGMSAVLATAVDSGSDATFVLAVQVLRLVLILLCAPLLAHAVARFLRSS
jgi:membrane AbrB-like protein